MAKKSVVKLAANFERNLGDIEHFLTEAEAPKAFDALLDELLDTVIPNLERFPEMGGSFLSRPIRSVEVANGMTALREKLSASGADPDALREYVMDHYLILYVQIGGKIHLLSIRHHRQLSFDFEAHWGTAPSGS